MKMGTTPSRFPYDAEARDTATIGKSTMLCHLALRIVDPPMLRVLRLPLNSGNLDQPPR